MTSFSNPTPALPPPSGQTSNFVNPESLLKWCVLCVSVCLAVTTLVFFLRMYVRVAVKREWILEDCKFLLCLHYRSFFSLLADMCCISWVSTSCYCLPQQDCRRFTLTLRKTGLVTYCALMTTVMHKHGGIHEWNLTKSEVHEAIYVSTISLNLSWADSHF